MMLRFYSFFKQATEGPCQQKKPAFWDVVGRAKYDAWSALGHMPKEKAMEGYVNELKKIVETMSFTENVANFVGSISEIEKVDVNDLELVAPEAMAHARSRPGSPFASRTPSPQRNGAESVANGLNGAKQATNGHVNSESDDEFNSAVRRRFIFCGLLKLILQLGFNFRTRLTMHIVNMNNKYVVVNIVKLMNRQHPHHHLNPTSQLLVHVENIWTQL